MTLTEGIVPSSDCPHFFIHIRNSSVEFSIIFTKMNVWHLKFMEHFSLYTYTCSFYSSGSIELVTVELTFKRFHICFNFWMTIRIQPAVNINKVKGVMPCGGTEICIQVACSSHFQRPWCTTTAVQDLHLPNTWHHCHTMLHDDRATCVNNLTRVVMYMDWSGLTHHLTYRY